MLAPSARYDEILETPKDGNLGAALIAAMEEIERAHPPLAGQFPKDYAHFDGDVLESMMRTFDTEALRKARSPTNLRCFSRQQATCAWSRTGFSISGSNGGQKRRIGRSSRRSASS